MFKPPIPRLRMFDENVAREFYVDFLGFDVDWEHRFEDNFPLYMQISKGSCVLHLTGHHGDSSPGTSLIINMTGIEAYNKALLAKDYKHARPHIEDAPHHGGGAHAMTIVDPFGNRLMFCEPKGQS